LGEHAAHAAAAEGLDRIDRRGHERAVLLERRALRGLERAECSLRERDDRAEAAVELEQIPRERMQLRIADLDDPLAVLIERVEHAFARVRIADGLRADEREG